MLLCLSLCLLAVRPRRPGGRPLPLRRHGLIGWLALGAALLHLAGSVLSDPIALEHLKPSTPWYELAGVLALLLLLMLTLPARERLRRRLWQRHRAFQALHVALACVLIVLLAVHVYTTGRYVHGPWRAAAFLSLSALAVLALLRRRAPTAAGHRPVSAVNALVFGRNSRLIIAVVALCLVAIGALAWHGAALALRAPLSARRERPPLDFPHEKHREVACVACHHNFTDHTGGDSCISCHRSARTDLRAGAEARFHDFCLGCHRDPPPPLTRHGPVTGCASCHVAAQP